MLIFFGGWNDKLKSGRRVSAPLQHLSVAASAATGQVLCWLGTVDVHDVHSGVVVLI